jgi:hypothetical protein
MSKQTSRQASKQGQTANKQSNNQSSKQAGPANKQTTNVSVKQDRPLNKQATDVSAKQTNPANKQTTNVPVKQDRPQYKQASNVSVKQTNPANKQLTRQAIKQERRQEGRQRRLQGQRAARRKRFLIAGLVAAALILVATVSVFAYEKAHNPAGQSQAVVNPAYPPVDTISCDQLEQTAYHIHAHVTIWINGQQVQIPQSIGIASDQSCLYWLHTHDSSGVIHIEAPNKVSPTLGNFLDIWGQKFPQLGFQNELASTAGWTVYVDGKQVNSNFNQLVLQPHMVITLAYNSPNIKPDTSYPWQQGQ